MRTRNPLLACQAIVLLLLKRITKAACVTHREIGYRLCRENSRCTVHTGEYMYRKCATRARARAPRDALRSGGSGRRSDSPGRSIGLFRFFGADTLENSTKRDLSPHTSHVRRRNVDIEKARPGV